MKHSFPVFSFLLLALLPRVANAVPRNVPTSDQKISISATSDPLEDVLTQLKTATGVSLQASGSLKQQRVTVFLREAELRTVAEALVDLLTPAPNATVFWTNEKKSWILTESLNRRRLAEQLQNQDLELYRQHLEAEVAWLRSEDEHQAKGQTGKVDPQEDPDTLRRVRNQRTALARFLDWLGTEGREKLLSGEPATVSIGKMPNELQKSFYAYLRQTLGSIAGLPDAEVNAYTVSYILARSPTGNRFTRLVQSIITPHGFVRSRASVIGMPQPEAPAFFYPPFNLMPVNPADTSRKVTFTVGVAPKARPGTRVFRNLDELLEEAGEGAGLQVIADGYLRTRRLVPANLRVEEYPVGQLMDQLTRVWNCEWRFVGEGEKTVLVRARNWWMEDAADIPEPLLEELHPRLNRKQVPELADLLQLAELSKAQLHKLIEAGYCPDACGLVQPGRYDETGPKSVFQFFNRLPKPLQNRVKSPQGLQLGDAPPELVQTWLRKTLTAYGAVESKSWTTILLRVETRPGDATHAGAVVVQLIGPLGAYPPWEISPFAPEARLIGTRENG